MFCALLLQTKNKKTELVFTQYYRLNNDNNTELILYVHVQFYDYLTIMRLKFSFS